MTRSASHSVIELFSVLCILFYVFYYYVFLLFETTIFIYINDERDDYISAPQKYKNSI